MKLPSHILTLGTIVLVLIVSLIASTFAFNNDLWNFKVWVDSITTHGFGGFYQRDFSPWAQANYPPLIIFALFVSSSLSTIILAPKTLPIIWPITYKLWGIIAQTGVIGYFLFRKQLTSALTLWFHPALIYNTILWGQTDALMTSIIFFSLISLHYPPISLALATMALLTKQSAVIFVPIVIYSAFKHGSVKQILLGAIISSAVFYLSFLPFSASKNPLQYLQFYAGIVQGQTHQHQASVNALNFWYALGLNEVSDATTFVNLPFRTLSLLMFTLLTLALIYRLHQTQNHHPNLYLQTAGLINLSAFLFLTRMHERHLLPTLILCVPKSIQDKRWWWYAPLSIIHTLNLYAIWNLPATTWGEQIFPRAGVTLAIVSVLLGSLALIHFFIQPHSYDTKP